MAAVQETVDVVSENEFAGSFRTDITNPSWQDERLVEKNAIAAGRGEPHLDTTNFI